MICGGWFNGMLINSSWSFGFLFCFYVPSNKSNAMLKKSTMCKSVFISILKPVLLKISIMSFRILSVFCLDVFLKSTCPSSLYNPVYCLSSLFDGKELPWFFAMNYKTTHGSLSLYNKDFLQCFIIGKFFSGISIYTWTNKIAFSNISLDIVG